MPIDPAGPSKGVVVLLDVATPLLPFYSLPAALPFALSALFLSYAVLFRFNPFDAPLPDRNEIAMCLSFACTRLQMRDFSSLQTNNAMSLLFVNSDFV